MTGNSRGNVVVAALILAVAMCVCTAGMLYGMKKFQNNIIRYTESQKEDAILRFKDQKNQLKKFVWNREARMRDFVRKELRSVKLELDNTK